ncbi:MAG: hypothetical protein ABMA25_15940, partial [Ilumatobacteraceae bacterium]
LTLCLSTITANSSGSGCSGNGELVDAPVILKAGALGGVFGVAIVAAVPVADGGAMVRFTEQNGDVTETLLADKTPNLPFHAAALAVTQPGTLEIISSDGRVLATDEISEDDLGWPSA